MSTKIKVEQDDGRLIIRVISHDTEVLVSVPSDKEQQPPLVIDSPPNEIPPNNDAPAPPPQSNTSILKFLKRKDDTTAETKLVRPKIPAQKSYRDAALLSSSYDSGEHDEPDE